MDQNIHITEVTTFSDELLHAVNHLGLQLDPAFEALNREVLEGMLHAPDTHLIVAMDQEKIVGMTTLCSYRIPYKQKAWIEDVVVDNDYRGKGIGTKLMEHAISMAKEKGVKSINLTSQPTREDANKLYPRLGFEKRETNVYRLNI